ncbi:L-fucose:H+ symporter permease [Flavihumibacter rivuli]|uniref:L-fucose:H+ symporter permease n=1 Tax=Flavihumibacter rivuli TaxID=2838156 RepID=UPI001BDF628C|nr:L-fucose:H+ symporter permease [Flavihumibacter rivuli]ULQ56990.1 L-fucose:H+ symporter permease [Flavihumibacter rivuli]
MKNKQSYLVAFIMVTSLFFLWAFLHNINPILIPHLKKACTLTDTESAFIDSSVYLSYFLVALPAGWFMHKYGYKNGILVGLLLYCIGAFLFVPAASARSYNFFLVALFIMAGGATFLETIANPYITKLGDPEGAAKRLNLAQSFNGVGSVIPPLIGGQFILSGIEHSPQELSRMSAADLDAYLSFEANAIKMPYMVIGGVVALILILFALVKLPEIKEAPEEGGESSFSLRVFRHRHFRWALLAQFFYIGAQVGIGSFFIRYARYVQDIPEKQAAFLWGSIAMVGFMAGRFVGTFLMKYFKPAVLLCAFALTNVALLAIAIFASGNLAVYALIATPFFMSIMFPTIFALGIDGLGEESKIASSFIVMSIVGGAFFPILMGQVSDANSGNIQLSYLVPVVCFLVVFWFGLTQLKKAAVKVSVAH